MYESAVAPPEPGLEARFKAVLTAAGLIEPFQPDAGSGVLAAEERTGYDPAARRDSGRPRVRAHG